HSAAPPGAWLHCRYGCRRSRASSQRRGNWRGQWPEPLWYRPPDARLGQLQVYRFRATRVRLDVERHALAFAKIADPGRLNSGGVDENVLRAAIRRNEAEALLRIEEFYSSDSH